MADLALAGFAADPFSSLSHLLALPVLLVLGYRLLRRGAGNGERVTALTVFVFSAVLLLAMSGVFHLLPPNWLTMPVPPWALPTVMALQAVIDAKARSWRASRTS